MSDRHHAWIGAARGVAPPWRQPRDAVRVRQPRVRPLAGVCPARRGSGRTRETMSSGCGGGPRSAARRTRPRRARCSGACRFWSRRSRLIDGRTLYYRGHGRGDAGAVAIARGSRRADLDRTVRGDARDARSRSIAPPKPSDPFIARAQSMLAVAAARDPLAFDLRPASVALTGGESSGCSPGPRHASDPGETTVDAALARHWHVGAPRRRMIVRAALILCADHELNVSSFTARCVASAGSHPYAVVIAGLAALEGPKHGGASARVESMLESMRRRGRPLRAAVAERLRRGESIDGFGHPLYRDGDPRARLLLDLLGERYAKSAEYRFVKEFAQAATARHRRTPEHRLRARRGRARAPAAARCAADALRHRPERRLDRPRDRAVRDRTTDSPARQVRRRPAGHGMMVRLRQLPDDRIEQALPAGQRLVSTMRSRSERHCANVVFCSAGVVRQLCGPIGDVSLR